jgi:hypothetical protein
VEVDSARGVNWSKCGKGGENSSVDVDVLDEAESEVVRSIEWSSESAMIWSLWVMEVVLSVDVVGIVAWTWVLESRVYIVS